MSEYKRNSITLLGSIGLGTGVMISAGIFALLGQMAELSGRWFVLLIGVGAVVTFFSAYSYMKMSEEYPSAGGIGMYLVKAYGTSTTASVGALMMALSMVINQSLVARTFGEYTMQMFTEQGNSQLVPILGVGLILFAFAINMLSNLVIQSFTVIVSLIKILGLMVFAFGGLYAARFVPSLAVSDGTYDGPTALGLVAAVALSVLAFKGFTTITNSGEEIQRPKINIKRSIVWSIVVSLVVYLMIAMAVSSSLSIEAIIAARDYSLSAAARPTFGQAGVVFTGVLAMVATITGIIASVFAVTRMLAMLSDMELIPSGKMKAGWRTQKQMLLYTTAIALVLTILFDLTRIASMGAILYLIMDMMVHYGLLRKLKTKVAYHASIVWTALILDGIVLVAFVLYKLRQDWMVVLVSLIAIVVLVIVQLWYSKRTTSPETD